MPHGSDCLRCRRRGQRWLRSASLFFLGQDLAHQSFPQCIDSQTNLERCGGCVGDGQGQDCTAIHGVESVTCAVGRCVVGESTSPLSSTLADRSSLPQSRALLASTSAPTDRLASPGTAAKPSVPPRQLFAFALRPLPSHFAYAPAPHLPLSPSFSACRSMATLSPPPRHHSRTKATLSPPRSDDS